MAATTTITEYRAHPSAVQQVKWVWQSASDGTSGGASIGITPNAYSGYITGAVFINGTTPTASYDVTVKDANGVDVLNGLGADLSNSATTYKAMKDGLGAIVNSTLQLDVANAGDTKGGTVVVTILRA